MHKRSGKRLHGVASSDAVDLTKITLKTLLQAVVEASDVFPPLKSVAAGLNFIVENAQTVKANKADMESLLRRMSRLSELPRLDDDEELRRREVLEKELENIRSVLSPIKKRNAVRRFVEASHTAALIQEYVRQITRALEEYQVSLLQDLYKLNIEQTVRHFCIS
ncbi:hypothetical protein BC835DRAFT_768432 [Cytidiella melzeri]|nr:hypothetical protein BC835DRAFT_768432 [Cytidiella melzeri]